MKIDLTFNLFGFTLSGLSGYFELTLATIKNSEGQCRSLFAIAYEKDMCFVLDICYIHIIYKA